MQAGRRSVLQNVLWRILLAKWQVHLCPGATGRREGLGRRTLRLVSWRWSSEHVYALLAALCESAVFTHTGVGKCVFSQRPSLLFLHLEAVQCGSINRLMQLRVANQGGVLLRPMPTPLVLRRIVKQTGDITMIGLPFPFPP